MTFQLGAGGRDPRLHLCAGQFVLEIRKLLATSEAEFNSLIGAVGGIGEFKTILDKSSGYFCLLEIISSLDVKEQEG